jgi:hypothetical protein
MRSSSARQASHYTPAGGSMKPCVAPPWVMLLLSPRSFAFAQPGDDAIGLADERRDVGHVGTL